MTDKLYRSLRAQGGGVLLLAWTLFLVFLYTRGNDFTPSWHFDEPSKAGQIIRGDYNFNHPLLLLLLSKAALMLAGGNALDPFHVAHVGRWVSAFAAAGAVALLALLAARLQGRLAGILTAVFVGASPLLFGLAHYMKEDPLFVFGLAAFLLALDRYDEKPAAGRLMLLGASAGLAVSAKYLGVVAVPIAVGFALWKGRQSGAGAAKTLLLAILPAAAVFAVVNFPALINLAHAAASLQVELYHVANSHSGFFRPIWSSYYGEALVRLTSPLAILLYLYWAVHVWRNRDRRRAAELAIAAFPLLFLLMLQVPPDKVVRYELPPIAVMTMGAACGAALLVAGPRAPRWRIASGAAAAALLIVFDLWQVSLTYQAIADDTRARMAQWIRDHLSPDAVVAQNLIVGLLDGRAAPPTPATVPAHLVYTVNDGEDRFLDLMRDGAWERARALGVQYILIADSDFGRFFNSGMRVDQASPDNNAKVERIRGFYRSLFKIGMLVYRLPGATPPGTLFSPGLWLFKIDWTPGADHSPTNGEIPTFDLLEQ